MSDMSNPDCTISILARAAPIDPMSETQLETTARTLPGMIHAVAQPDLHPGNRFPIGAVFVSQDWIHPPLIGTDIGCGMAWYKTTLTRKQVDGDKGKKVADKLRGLEGPWRASGDRIAWLTSNGTCISAGEQCDRALGTVGAGNHFAEIQVVEASSATELLEDEVILLVHSGSRGYGEDILNRHTAAGKTSLLASSEEAQAYMKEHDSACLWAKASRDLIALRFFSCLEPGEPTWAIGQNDSEDVPISTLNRAKELLQARKVVDIWHNNVERIAWPPAPPSPASGPDLETATSTLNLRDRSSSDYVFVHRKGAAPTYNPSTGQPLGLLPLPGSRATPTIILRPSFSEQTGWGSKNALSLAHGAGRSMSRAKARVFVEQRYKNSSALLSPSSSSQAFSQPSGADVHGGTWVICDEKELVYEEAPEAYKDVYAVSNDLVQNGVAEVLGWCRARVSYKVRNESR